MDPAVRRVEPFHWVDGEWHTRNSGAGDVTVFVYGIDPNSQGLMFNRVLAPDLRANWLGPTA